MMKPNFLLSLLLCVIVMACDNNKTTKDAVVTTNDSSTVNSAIDTSKKDEPATHGALRPITVKQYKISRTDLAAQFSNNKKLLILKTHFSDLETPTTLRVMLYPAKNHKDHGEGQAVLGGVTDQGTTSIETSNIILGNNYARLKKILEKPNGSARNFTYLLIKPNTTNLPGHLVYHLIAVTVKKEGAQTLLSEEDLGFTNPSPPAPPLEL